MVRGGALCFVLVPGGFPCCAHLCIAPLCRVSLRARIGLCVSWCPFSRAALGLFWCWVSSCCVMCLGVRCVVVCCVVALCFGALGWMLVCGVRYSCSMLCVVVCRLVALYNTLCCAPLFCRWLWCCVPCYRVCCRVLCLGVAWCCGFVLLVALRSSIVVPCVASFVAVFPRFCGGVFVVVFCGAALCCCDRCCVVFGYVFRLGTWCCCVVVWRCTVV